MGKCKLLNCIVLISLLFTAAASSEITNTNEISSEPVQILVNGFPLLDAAVSDGTDGPFHPNVSMTLTLPDDGIFNYTTINIPAGVTIRFRNNAANTAVFMAATADVTINGNIILSASGSSPGPGGFNGGSEGYGAGDSGQNGFGPGGGPGGPGNGSAGGGAAMATPGGQGYKSNAGPTPAEGGKVVSLSNPIKGGNGGGGGGGQSVFGVKLNAGRGGAGGGAIQIASPGNITIGGSFQSYGGNGGYGFANVFAHAGAGGAGSGGNLSIIGGSITVLPTASFSMRGGYGGGISTQPYSQNPPLYSCGANGGTGYVVIEGDLYLPSGFPANTAVFQCEGFASDLTGNCFVDMEDIALLASNWMKLDCEQCNGADTNNDGNVDFDDLLTILQNWLLGIR